MTRGHSLHQRDLSMMKSGDIQCSLKCVLWKHCPYLVDKLQWFSCKIFLCFQPIIHRLRESRRQQCLCLSRSIKCFWQKFSSTAEKFIASPLPSFEVMDREHYLTSLTLGLNVCSDSLPPFMDSFCWWSVSNTCWRHIFCALHVMIKVLCVLGAQVFDLVPSLLVKLFIVLELFHS